MPFLTVYLPVTTTKADPWYFKLRRDGHLYVNHRRVLKVEKHEFGSLEKEPSHADDDDQELQQESEHSLLFHSVCTRI